VTKPVKRPRPNCVYAEAAAQQSKDVFDKSFEWIALHEIFEAGSMGSGVYDQSVVSLAG
jgi:hypothetical protein